MHAASEMYVSYTSTVGEYRTYPLGLTHGRSYGSRSLPSNVCFVLVIAGAITISASSTMWMCFFFTSMLCTTVSALGCGSHPGSLVEITKQLVIGVCADGVMRVTRTPR